MLAALLWPAVWATASGAQSNPQPAQPPAAQRDNPFPGNSSAKPKTDNANPFPDESSAPVIVVDPASAAAAREAARPAANPNADAPVARRGDDPDGDPVRSPDPPGMAADGGFSSSREGLTNVPMEDVTDARPGKSTKNKTRGQYVQEDLDIAKFYLDQKNWKGAQGRFNSALALDGENIDAIWGLAEAERHLQLYKEAAEHLKLFLSYDPDGPHSKAAKKNLDEVELRLSSQTASPVTNESPPK